MPYLKKSHDNLVESKAISIRRALVKIVRLPTEESDKAAVKATIMESNDWLAGHNFEITQVYNISIGTQSTYTNCSIECEVETQEEILRRGAINFGDLKCRAYEQIEVMQCNNCSRLGHISMNCPGTITCRKCSENHSHNVCTSTTLKCINCDHANTAFGKAYNTAHNSAFDRCPARLERIEAIKRLVLSKN